MKASGIHHVGLTVRNLDVSIEHYCGIFGLNILDRTQAANDTIRRITGLTDAEVKIADLVCSNGDVLELMEYVIPAVTFRPSVFYHPGLSHFSLQVDSIDLCYERLLDRNVTVRSPPVRLDAPGTIWHNSRVLYSFDPDDRVVELIELP